MLFVLFTIVLPLALAAPEQVHLAFHGNFSVMNVVWTTFESDTSTVHYGTSPSNMPFSVSGSQKAWRTGSITRYSHRALMINLLPSTTYWYRIGSRIFQFKTMAENPTSYRVCVFGDLGYYHGNSTASIIRNGLSGKFDFIVHVGDISYDLHTGDGKNGDEFMNQLEPLLSRIPYMVIAGNHENDGRNFSNFQERFWMPHNGYHDNQFYSFDLGPVHWVGLSTEYYGYYQSLGKGPVFTQYNWLKQDLAHANSNRHHTPWIISYLHRPFYCSAEYNDDCSGFDNSLIRVGHDDLPGLEYPFLQYGVDLGFWGHVHYYERFYPVANKKYWNSGNCYHNAPAPTYVITGSAGCHTPNTPFDRTPVPFSAKRLNDYGYTILTVANRTHIHLQQLSVNKGESVVDEFWLSKDEGFVASDKLRALTPGQDFPKPTLAKIPHNENYMPDWIDIPPIQ
ncbi:hypothetical protein Y032_0014g2249 [Ancylostoma ceylanicum]|uniref:Purple acid phosphatase n=1 Tax=Ancylostoma ceylanicum TaxID=53326 RepID=A0A016V8J0_9BILA|nr:hypothetical protein Y032_0014g2249 [Ancylostoma ceylanicum]